MKSWQGRYQNYFRHLWSNQVEESQSFTSDTSIGTHVLEEREAAKVREAAVPQVPVRPPAIDRPSRVRKPAQRDSKIITWSEAVDTIRSLDPVLHAEMLEDTKRMKVGYWPSDYPGTGSNPGKSFSENRPRVNESADGYRPKNNGRTFENFAVPESHPESMPVAASPSPEETKVRAPCPHADCRPYDTIVYRLQRLDKEDLSEMCLHLFRVHHTTPFPCGEIGCKRKGEDGFFMQADLVKHVRIDHPNAGAFQRLRGRVDSDLLDRNTRPPKNMSSVPLNDRPVSRARDSDFMSPSKRNDRRVTPSSRPFSSSSDHDRTPRGTTGMLGASTSTPMTSVSSLKVNRSSGTTVVMREASEFQERLMSEEQVNGAMDMSNWAGHAPTQHFNGPVFAKARTPPVRESLLEGSPLSRSISGRDVLPTPLASIWDSPRHEGHGLSAPHDNPQSVSRNTREVETESSLPKPKVSRAIRTASGSQLPPLYKLANPPSSLDKGRTSSLPEPRNKALSNNAPSSQLLPRNTLDPSYEFSDEEASTEPAVTQTMPKSNMAPSTASQPAANISPTQTTSTEPSTKSAPAPAQPVTKAVLPTPATKSAKKSVAPQMTKSLIATPANKRKSTLQRVLDDDYDELSLGADDFVFMFSRPRTDARPTSNVRVKQEDSTETPQFISSVPARKRKLSMFRAGSDDELCVIGPSPPHPLSTVSKPDVKVEEDDAALPLPLPAKPKLGTIRVSDIQAEASSSQPNSYAQQRSNNQSATTSTPLLNLTPSQSKPSHPNDSREILDSAAESSSPNQASSPTHPRKRTRGQREAGTSSPLVGPLTPVKRKRWSGDPLKGEEVTVVVKTPGGSLRRCGEDRFECGRSFCFRCGEKSTG
ncbi:hypothetical protein N431DRAFT_64758 [Stipitochalara longipes BDJ]|nr:hypothetical protein N431DRAFT_64758 [Stipitochalara longipes BDJ]